MKEQEIIEGNKLIAEFMGLEWKLHLGRRYLYNHAWIPLENLKYHSSWDWLMPVVEKIETMVIQVPEKYKRGFMKDSTEASVSIDSFYDEREEFKGWTWSVHFNAGNYIADHTGDRIKTKIESIYLAVLAFIKWYNNQPNQ